MCNHDINFSNGKLYFHMFVVEKKCSNVAKNLEFKHFFFFFYAKMSSAKTQDADNEELKFDGVSLLMVRLY